MQQQQQADAKALTPSSSSSCSLPKSTTCSHCQTVLPSRSKLFQHINLCHLNPNNDCENGGDNDDDEMMDVDEVPESLEIAARKPNFYRVVVKCQGLPTLGGKNGLAPGQPGRNAANHPSLVIHEQTEGYKIARAMPCHRLDAATGGLLVCAESFDAGVNINASFRTRLVHKRYRAIVIGRLVPASGNIDSPISGKESVTDYKVVSYCPSKAYGTVTTVDLWPVTGRRHQLRKHLLELGFPILGDKRYTHANTWPPGLKHLLLWSLEVSFPDPSRVFVETLLKSNPSGAGLSVAAEDMVTVVIDEPECFEEFRRAQRGEGGSVK